MAASLGLRLDTQPCGGRKNILTTTSTRRSGPHHTCDMGRDQVMGSRTMLLLVSTTAASAMIAGVSRPGAAATSPAAAAVQPLDLRMMAREVEYGDAARLKLMRGVDQVANAVKVTLGPRGRNVLLYNKNRGARVVNDGVTIANEVELSSHTENVGVKLLLQAASQTDSRAGDGTTTATVLTQAIMREGCKFVSAGHNPMALRSGLYKASRFFVGKIREAAKPVTTLEQYQQIASISCNDWDMGGLLAEALDRVGIDGATIFEEGQGLEDSVEYTEGMEIEVGWLSNMFITELETQMAPLDKPRVLVTDQKITTLAEILPVLEKVVEDKSPLLIIASDVTGEALSGLVLNLNRGVLAVAAVKAPGLGDVRRAFLDDICTFTGATLVTSDLGMKLVNTTLGDLGKLDRAVVEKSKTLLVGTGECDEAANKEFEVQRLEQRIVKLRGAVARIKIGAPTEAAIIDKKLRYEDAVNALRGGIAEGMVPGGGACLAHMTRHADECKELMDNDEERLAVDMLVAAMMAPVIQIGANCGKLGELIAEKLKEMEWGFGFNAQTMVYEDLFAAVRTAQACRRKGVIDPASVTTWALENAASISGAMLTTEAVVTDRSLTEDMDPEDYEPEFGAGIGKRAAELSW